MHHPHQSIYLRSFHHSHVTTSLDDEVIINRRQQTRRRRKRHREESPRLVALNIAVRVVLDNARTGALEIVPGVVSEKDIGLVVEQLNDGGAMIVATLTVGNWIDLAFCPLFIVLLLLLLR